MARAGNFKRNTILVLAQRVGYLCSNPDCRTLTAGAHQDPSKSIIVGAASHICGGTPGGPRYDPNITDGERSDISNGIWLCANDHQLIDSDPDKYPVEILQEWKAKAERHATTMLYGKDTDLAPPILIKKKKKLGFTSQTKLILGQRVGYLCSNPDCRRLTVGPDRDPSKIIMFGEACHICGATPGGPRYNPNITDGERSDISNGIWLCANDHLLIDSDPDKYSVEFLKEWKVKAERHQTSPISIKKLKVFLCHASEDKPAARALFKKLQKDNCDPWLDTEKLIPGSEWKLEISRAVRDSDVVIVCLSEKSITKKGYIQKEIRVVLDEADEQPPGDIYVIPLRLENCEVPERFRDWHWVNFYEDGGYDNLIRALRIKADSIGLDIPRVEGQGVSEKQVC